MSTVDKVKLWGKLAVKILISVGGILLAAGVHLPDWAVHILNAVGGQQVAGGATILGTLLTAHANTDVAAAKAAVE